MFTGPTVFAQIMAAVPAWEFRRLASRHGLLGRNQEQRECSDDDGERSGACPNVHFDLLGVRSPV